MVLSSPAIITGSVIQLRADKGRVKVVDNGSGGSSGGVCRPCVKFSPKELSLYGPAEAVHAELHRGPALPAQRRAGQAMWKARTGKRVDG